MNNYISIRFQSTPEQSEMICALLMDMGFEGAEENGNETTISIPENAFNETAVKAIMQQFNVDYNTSTVAQQNWNAQWESSFEPVHAGDFALIRASFHEPKEGVQHDIIVTPKMSFRTGHHATTYLMIELMKDINFNDQAVIDFGTGTGVLAILAEKLGAKNVLHRAPVSPRSDELPVLTTNPSHSIAVAASSAHQSPSRASCSPGTPHPPPAFDSVQQGAS